MVEATTPDELSTAWQRLSENFDNLHDTSKSLGRIRQTIFDLAISGKLISNDLDQSGATARRDRILEERERQVRDTDVRTTGKFFSIEEAIFGYEFPPNWTAVSLNEICTLITDGKHGDCRDRRGSGYYFLSAKDVADGRLNYEQAREITQSDFQEVHQRTNLASGDVLITNAGTIGRIAIAVDDERTTRTTFQKSVAVLKPVRAVIRPEFMEILLTGITRQVESSSQGSAMKNLLLRDIKSFGVGVPPIAEQDLIIRRVSKLLSLCINLAKQVGDWEQLQTKFSDATVHALAAA